MRSSIQYVMSLLILCFLAAGLYAAPSKSTPKAGATPQTEEGGRGPVNLGVVKGPGTEANIFDDNSLIYTPVPTATPVFTIKTPEIEAWGLLVDTKSLLNRCAKDTKRYTKTFKKDFMEGYNDMGREEGGFQPRHFWTNATRWNLTGKIRWIKPSTAWRSPKSGAPNLMKTTKRW